MPPTAEEGVAPITSPATGAVEGAVSLIDSRNDTYDQFSWLVLFAPTNSADSLVTDVHLHQTGTDDLLYTFPVSVHRALPNVFDWMVSESGTSLYRGSQSSVPFDLLYELVSSDGTYIDVHTAAHPVGARGPVAVTSDTGWTPAECD